mmetsp:Transcript_100360/g.289814  ORF Transcript_100360/g.289814 Transcript_100360/m.289814 type:complete len:138 (-) Transcript_100360:156-569(-)
MMAATAESHDEFFEQSEDADAAYASEPGAPAMAGGGAFSQGRRTDDAPPGLGLEGGEGAPVSFATGTSSADVPTLGSAMHRSGACKPCLFWYQGLCHKGRRCLFCHIPHDPDEVSKVRPSKKTRNLLQQSRGGQSGT